MTALTFGSRHRVGMLAFCALLALGVSAGCATDTPARSVAAEPARMDTEARQALPPGFPREVPVIAAEIVAGESTGDPLLGPWRVDLSSGLPPERVLGWYRDTFATVGWEVASEQPVAGGTAIALVKGAGAWTTVRVTGTGSGSEVEMWVGLGVPVPPEALPDVVEAI